MEASRGGRPGIRVAIIVRTMSVDVLLRTAVEPAIAQYSSCYAMARGHRLNILVVLAAVRGLLGLPGRSARSSLKSLFLPLTPLSPSLISHLASVDVKQHVYLLRT